MHNYKFFLLFLLYKTIALACCASILLAKCKTEQFGLLDFLIESPRGTIVMLVAISLSVGLSVLLTVSLRLVS